MDKCRIEDSPERKSGKHSGPQFEVFAPDGFRFVGGPHSLMAYNKKDAEADSRELIESCPDDCDCKETS